MTIRRQPADVVQFTRASAERIAQVVRASEETPLPGSPLQFSRELDQRNPKVFRIATYTGAWAIGDFKTVTFKYQSSTPNTASVQNLFFPLRGAYPGDCAIARDRTAWFLVSVPLHTASAIFSKETFTQTALLSLSISAELNTNDCTITVQQTAETQTMMLFTNTFTAYFVSLEPVES